MRKNMKVYKDIGRRKSKMDFMKILERFKKK